jgi:hypothetical protein
MRFATFFAIAAAAVTVSGAAIADRAVEREAQIKARAIMDKRLSCQLGGNEYCTLHCLLEGNGAGHCRS